MYIYIYIYIHTHKGQPPDETDNANYFCEYAYLCPPQLCCDYIYVTQ